MRDASGGEAPKSHGVEPSAFEPPLSGMRGAVFPAVPTGPAATMLAVLYQLRVTERLDPEERRRWQFRQIAELVAHSERNVPHYGVTLRRAGLGRGQVIDGEAWSRVPVLTRAEVQQAGAKLHARELPKEHGSVATATTSGSSGRPVTIRKTALSQFYWQCFVVREQEWQARNLQALWMTMRRDDEAKADGGSVRRLPNWGEPFAAVYATGPALLVDYRAGVGALFASLLRERPAYLTTLPSVLRELLRESQRLGRVPERLVEVRCFAEALSAELAALCREVWGVRVTEVYSAAEIGIIASPCREANALHVNEEGVLVEILRADGTACDVGEEGDVVLTPLHNFAMPLLRYAIGDRAVWGPPCACGRTLAVLASIPGRARDMLTLADGTRRFPFYGHNAMMRVGAIAQHQVAQVGPTQVEIRLVVVRALMEAEERQIVDAAGKALGAPFEVSLKYVDGIARGPGGKYAEFCNEVLA
jgi:phenylacetate-CoA ligase